MTARPQLSLLGVPRPAEALAVEPLVFDYFAGGGGVSEGIRRALGRAPDVAINHDPASIRMHRINHRETLHLNVGVFDVDPVRDLPAGPVGLVWLSPDCTHFSRAKGGKPVRKAIRGLAWIALRVAARRRPSVIVVENVVELLSWGPLTTRGPADRRRPLRSKAGVTFAAWKRQLEGLGYVVEHRVLDAADYGAPTHRRRLIIVARCDGQPIAWPEPTHGPGRALPYRTAAECIDWSIPCPSIFGRKRPLAEATQRRIAEGLRRFVLENPRPFLVQVNHGRDVNRSRDLDRPMPTITSHHGFGVVSPYLVQTGQGERVGQTPRVRDVQRPYPTVVAGGVKQGLVMAWLVKHYGGVTGHGVERPIGTITARDHHSIGEAAFAPSGEAGERARTVAAFVTKYYGQGTGQALAEPLHTIVSKARFGLVTVELDGTEWALVDIGLRMLTPRELARCQGFPDSYELIGNQAQQTARVGNSVPPQLAEAIVRANVPGARRAAA